MSEDFIRYIENSTCTLLEKKLCNYILLILWASLKVA